MSDLTDISSYAHREVYIAFGISSGFSFFILLIYFLLRHCRHVCRRRNIMFSNDRPRVSIPPVSHRTLTSGSIVSQLGGLLPPSLDDVGPRRDRHKKTDSDVEVTLWNSWPDPQLALGIDLGSYCIKAHAIKSHGGTAGKLFSQRTVAGVLHDDTLVIGEVAALSDESVAAAVGELPYELGRRDDAALCSRDNATLQGRHSLVQILAEFIRRYTHSHDAVIGISVPPQITDTLAPKLYAIAASAGLRRCFFFTQTAALSACILHRRNLQTRTLSGGAGGGMAADRRPKPKWVIFADIGATGASVAICEVGEVSATCRREFYRREGPRPCMAMASTSIMSKAPLISPWDAQEAASALLQAYASMEEYLKHQGASAHATVRSGATSTPIDVYMNRENFSLWFQSLYSDLDALAQEASSYLTRGIEGRRPDEPIEIVFHGSLFNIEELRSHFQGFFQNVRSVVRPAEVAVSEGLAILAARQYPDKNHGHTYDIEPLLAIHPVPARIRDAVLYATKPAILRTASRLLNSAPSFAGAVQGSHGSGAGTPYRRVSSLI